MGLHANNPKRIRVFSSVTASDSNGVVMGLTLDECTAYISAMVPSMQARRPTVPLSIHMMEGTAMAIMEPAAAAADATMRRT